MVSADQRHEARDEMFLTEVAFGTIRRDDGEEEKV